MLKSLLPLLLLAAAGTAQTVPVGQMLTKGNVSIVVLSCCATVDPQSVGVPNGFAPHGVIVHVATTDPYTDEFRIAVRYRTKDGVERRDVHQALRRGAEPTTWTAEYFSIGDAEVIAVVVTERKPAETVTFTP